jgi:phospholipid/cholesterol/gamma-HCH transport system permease protein
LLGLKKPVHILQLGQLGAEYREYGDDRGSGRAIEKPGFRRRRPKQVAMVETPEKKKRLREPSLANVVSIFILWAGEAGVKDRSKDGITKLNTRSSYEIFQRGRQISHDDQGHVLKAGELENVLEGIHAPVFRDRYWLPGHRGHHIHIYRCGIGGADGLPANQPAHSKVHIAQIVRDTIILEFAPTLVCIVLAGVIGSKIAGELGNMRVSEQIDALEIMGINTKAYLVLPKILAALLVIPMLVVIATVLGLYGGRLAGTMAGIISADEYDKGLLAGFIPYNTFFALVKAYTFAFLISSISSYYGYHVKGGALEIGRASTKAVVVSCILILIADYVLSALLL